MRGATLLVPERIIKIFLDLGVDEISLGDTIGVGTPEDVNRILDLLKHCPVEKIAMHFHDTYARALGNVYASLKYGVLFLIRAQEEWEVSIC